LEAAIAALREALNLIPNDHRDRAALLSNLGGALRARFERTGDLSDLEQAIVSTRQALAATGAEDSQYPAILNNLGAMLSETGRYQEALEAAREAVDIRRVLAAQNPGIYLPDMAMSLNNLGTMLSETGRYQEALEAAREAVDIRRVLAAQNPGIYLPDMASALSNLSNRLSEIGRYQEALEAAREAVDIRRELAAQNPDFYGPSLAGSLANLAGIHLSLGDIGQSVSLYEQALAGMLRVQGTDHPNILVTRSGLASAYRSSGNIAGAAAMYEGLLTDYLRVLGPDHPDTLNVRHNLTSSRGQLGDAAGAAAAFEELLTDYLRVLGPDHPDTLNVRGDLAFWRGEAGDAAGAVAAFEELLTDYLRVLGPDHPHTLTTRQNLAYRRGQLGDAAGAAAAFEELLTSYLRVLGPDHPHTLTTQQNLAHWLSHPANKAGNPVEATPPGQKASQPTVLPVYIVCDESSSMSGEPIRAVNDALAVVINTLALNPVISEKIRLSVIGFSDSAHVLLPLTDLATTAAIPPLFPQGAASFGKAFDLLYEVIPTDLSRMSKDGSRLFRPVIFFLSDGHPTDDWAPSYRRLTDRKWSQHPRIVTFGFGEANNTTMRTIATVRAFYADETQSVPAAIREIPKALVSSVVDSVSAPDGGSTGSVVITPVSIPGFTALSVLPG
jgi:uncharacterized protein YegL/tetratricopeptide (TPR) repeat protein